MAVIRGDDSEARHANSSIPSYDARRSHQPRGRLKANSIAIRFIKFGLAASLSIHRIGRQSPRNRADRPCLTAALAFVREGDILVVWKLDRLGRSLPHLIEIRYLSSQSST